MGEDFNTSTIDEPLQRQCPIAQWSRPPVAAKEFALSSFRVRGNRFRAVFSYQGRPDYYMNYYMEPGSFSPDEQVFVIWQIHLGSLDST